MLDGSFSPGCNLRSPTTSNFESPSPNMKATENGAAPPLPTNLTNGVCQF